MSRGCQPRLISGGRRSRGWNPAEIRLMALAGLFLGLVGFHALPPSPTAATPGTAAASLSPAATDSAPSRPASLRVIDGDTFDYGGARIRIADIDTPELRGRCPEESVLAARATRRIRALLDDGPFELRAVPGGRDMDRYGRKLRIVTRGGRSLGDVLVAEGLARTWTGRREPWCA